MFDRLATRAHEAIIVVLAAVSLARWRLSTRVASWLMPSASANVVAVIPGGTARIRSGLQLFQQGRKAEVVRATHRLLQAGLLVSSLVGIVYALLWFVLPAWLRGSLRRAASAGRRSRRAPPATTHPYRDPQI